MRYDAPPPLAAGSEPEPAAGRKVARECDDMLFSA